MTAKRPPKPNTAKAAVAWPDSSRRGSGAGPDFRFFLMLLALFFASGCAALIYEIVWFQLLELTIGSSSVSIAVLLATFMGGMAIGSLGVAKVVPIERHPLRVYAVIEFAIGAFGLLVLWALPYAGGLYTAIGGHGTGGLAFRALLSVLCLLGPTVLMGATLPAVSRWIGTTRRGESWLGYLYGGNTLGSVAGGLLAGFYLLRVFDMGVATYVAVAINVIIGVSALLLARTTAYSPQTDVEPAAVDAKVKSKAKAKPTARPALWPVLVTIGLSGMTALSAEVVWTRLLALMFGATTYTYSLILAGILLGLGIGSYAASFLIGRTNVSPRVSLAACQVGLAAAIAWSAYLVMSVLPFQPNDAALSSNLFVSLQHDLSLTLATVLPAALLWGASFPLALAAAARERQDPGRSVGQVYASNTFGAIVGSLGTSLLAMAMFGSQHILQGLIVIAALSGVLVLLPIGAKGTWLPQAVGRTAAYVVAPLVLALALVAVVQPIPGQLVGYGPGSSAWQDAFGKFIFVGEGMNSSVAISELTNGTLNYHNAGKVQASSEPQDLRLERMLGHLTTLIPSDPKNVLVIGFGAGVTAGAASIDPKVEKMTIVEIEPLVSKASDTYFAKYNEGVARNPKTSVVIDDGRHYLMTTGQTFDAITLDPFDPWTKGAAALSTEEFFKSAKAHLNPGGVMTVWIPLYQMREYTAQSEIATFRKVFPNAVVWGNLANSRGYDIVISGSVDDAPIDVDLAEARISSREYAKVRASLASVGFRSAKDLFATFGVRGADMDSFLSGAELNTDMNLRLQYLAGVGLDANDSDAIYQDMIGARTWPQDLFKGSATTIAALKKAIESQHVPAGQ